VPLVAIVNGRTFADDTALIACSEIAIEGRQIAQRDDERVRLGRLRPAEATHEAAHAGVLGGKAVVVDEIAPDRHRVAAPADRELDQVPVRLARTGGRRPAGRWRPRRQPGGGRQTHAKVGGHRTGRICRVGGHLYGRFWVSTEGSTQLTNSAPPPPDLLVEHFMAVRADGDQIADPPFTVTGPR
jgi:hypothetical protein